MLVQDRKALKGSLHVPFVYSLCGVVRSVCLSTCRRPDVLSKLALQSSSPSGIWPFCTLVLSQPDYHMEKNQHQPTAAVGRAQSEAVGQVRFSELI